VNLTVSVGGRREIRTFREASSGFPERVAARWGIEDMAAKAPGWRRGSSPEAAKRCASWRRALRATTVPVRLNVDGDSVFLIESVLEFVADGAEKAGHRGALSVASE
jgi:hypothetical protein